EAVTDDELVLDREADVIDLHVHLPTRRLAEETRRTDALRGARPQNVLQVAQREPGVDDVLDDDDVASFEAAVQILQDPHLAGRPGPLPVARYRHEVHRHMRSHGPDEIGHEHEATLQDRYEMDLLPFRVAALDLGGQTADAILDL